MNTLPRTLDRALQEAVAQHFCKIFGVLMTDPKSPEALQRFQNGLDNLCHAYVEVSSILAEQEERGYADPR